MSQVQLEAFFLVQNACTAFHSTFVSMLELSPPLPIFLLLRVAGMSGLNTIIVPVLSTTVPVVLSTPKVVLGRDKILYFGDYESRGNSVYRRATD
jgi:hypothetical protein